MNAYLNAVAPMEQSSVAKAVYLLFLVCQVIL
jgi:hypothetical protein